MTYLHLRWAQVVQPWALQAVMAVTGRLSRWKTSSPCSATEHHFCYTVHATVNSCRVPRPESTPALRRTYTGLSDGAYVFLVQSVTLTAILGPATETDFAVDTTGPVLTNISVTVGCARTLLVQAAAACSLEPRWHALQTHSQNA